MLDVLVAVGLLVAAWAAARGTTLLVRGLKYADEESSSLDLIRGIRAIAVAVAMAALGGGLLLEQRWLLVFGIVFLLEELYETGVVILVLRAAREQGLAARRDRQHGSGRVISLTTTTG